MYLPEVPKAWPVQPTTVSRCIDPKNAAKCGTCLRTWDNGIVTSLTPSPGARCPFEPFHPINCGECGSDDVARGKREGDMLAPDTSFYLCGGCGHAWGEE